MSWEAWFARVRSVFERYSLIQASRDLGQPFFCHQAMNGGVAACDLGLVRVQSRF